MVTSPNQACLWGSYSKERISVRVNREGGSPVMQDRFPQRSWYQAWHGMEIFGTARIIRARHGNIWHGTDHKGPARKYLARHGSTRSGHGTARDIAVMSDTEPGGHGTREQAIRSFSATIDWDPTKTKRNEDLQNANLSCRKCRQGPA